MQRTHSFRQTFQCLPTRLFRVWWRPFQKSQETLKPLKVMKALLLNRAQISNALHESIEFSLNRAFEQALKGLEWSTSNSKMIRLHLILMSYIADIPESEHIFPAKRGTRSSSPFHESLISEENFESNKTAQRRSLSIFWELIFSAQPVSVAGNDKI